MRRTIILILIGTSKHEGGTAPTPPGRQGVGGRGARSSKCPLHRVRAEKGERVTLRGRDGTYMINQTVLV